MPQSSATRVYLARHGQTAYNHQGRFQGQQQIPLDETGRAQALELAERALPYGFRRSGPVPLSGPAKRPMRSLRGSAWCR